MDNRYIETSLGDQILNRKLTSYRETTVLKQYYLILSLLKRTFLLLHAEIGVGNKIVYTYFD